MSGRRHMRWGRYASAALGLFASVLFLPVLGWFSPLALTHVFGSIGGWTPYAFGALGVWLATTVMVIWRSSDRPFWLLIWGGVALWLASTYLMFWGACAILSSCI